MFAKYIASGQPKPPTPIINTLVLEFFFDLLPQYSLIVFAWNTLKALCYQVS